MCEYPRGYDAAEKEYLYDSRMDNELSDYALLLDKYNDLKAYTEQLEDTIESIRELVNL